MCYFKIWSQENEKKKLLLLLLSLSSSNCYNLYILYFCIYIYIYKKYYSFKIENEICLMLFRKNLLFSNSDDLTRSN